MGATLAKLALRGPDGVTRYELLPAGALERVAARIASVRPRRVGLTGGGATRLASLLDPGTAAVDEFRAWAHGARGLLREQGVGADGDFLLVSLGTGTSALRVGRSAVRVGGTALGGGTLMGLGRALTGAQSYAELTELARAGDRRRVDLLVADIYRGGDAPLPGELNAASFGKLGDGDASRADARDLAHAVVGLVGENVALICCGLAAAAGVGRIVFGGSTLRENPALTEILTLLCTALGREPVLLAKGEFAGALGALELVTGSSGGD